MPGIQHDTANSLVREHPELVIRLLRTVGGFQLPESAQVRVVDGELNDRPSNDLHADTVIMGGPVHDPWFTVASEIETRLTPVKFEQALRYAVALWLRLRKPVYVLFITSDPQARKFAVPVTAEAGGLTLILCPCVCGPDEIPALTDPAQVADDPAMAALSVMAHGDEPGVSEAFLTGLNGLDPDDAPRYHEYAYRMAAVPVRRILEALMATTTWPVYSPFARKHFGEGKAEGLAEGLAEGKAAAVVAVLEARGLPLTEGQRGVIEGTIDQGVLDGWLCRVSAVASAEELLGGVPG